MADYSRNIGIENKYERDFRRTVLIADDEPVNLRLLGNILSEDYEILYAQSAQETMDAIRSQRDFISLILLDQQLGLEGDDPVMNRIMAEEGLSGIPVIVLTSDSRAEVRCLEKGAVDFIGKPFDRPEVVRARVDRVMELYIGKNIVRSTGVDQLTGLMSEDFFLQYCREYDKYHPEQPVDAIVMDYSRFYLVNDFYGKSFGDKVICAMARAALSFVRACNGVACRCDSACFYLYIEHQDNYDFLVNTITNELKELMDPAEVRVRIGVYSDIYHAADLEQRFLRAFQANDMISRKSYPAAVYVYDNEMHEKELYEESLLKDIDSAFRENQFSLVFQPKYDITGEQPRLSGAEVLVRWKHPRFGFVRPNFFVPLLEDHGRINELDRFVWKEAAKQIHRWKDMYGVTIPVSVNVSRVDTYDPELTKYLLELVKSNGLEPWELHLEISETTYADNTRQIAEAVKELQRVGFLVEMDDFGKGYSSLNMLSTLPIDALKLDMAFIKGIAENNKELSLVQFIIQIAGFLKVPVIAEGVETAEQYVLLKQAGCDIIQGYYFSKPVSASEFGHLIERNIGLYQENTAAGDEGAYERDASEDAAEESISEEDVLEDARR